MTAKKSIPKPALISDMDKKILASVAAGVAERARLQAANESFTEEAGRIESRDDLSTAGKAARRTFYRDQLAKGLSKSELEKTFKTLSDAKQGKFTH